MGEKVAEGRMRGNSFFWLDRRFITV